MNTDTLSLILKDELEQKDTLQIIMDDGGGDNTKKVKKKKVTLCDGSWNAAGREQQPWTKEGDITDCRSHYTTSPSISFAQDYRKHSHLFPFLQYSTLEHKPFSCVGRALGPVLQTGKLGLLNSTVCSVPLNIFGGMLEKKLMLAANNNFTFMNDVSMCQALC